jgi:hypothetical protein
LSNAEPEQVFSLGGLVAFQALDHIKANRDHAGAALCLWWPDPVFGHLL